MDRPTNLMVRCEAALGRALLVERSTWLECLRLERFQVRSRKHDDRAGGVADATRGHRADQNLVYTSVPVTAHDEQTGVPCGMHEPLDGWPLDDFTDARVTSSRRMGARAVEVVMRSLGQGQRS
jgi:hypothetical protein